MRITIAALGAALLLAAGAAPAMAETFTVTKTADTADGTCDADCSLREAVQAANQTEGTDAITLPAGEYFLTNESDIDVHDDVAITGAGADTTRIDGEELGDRLFEVFRGASFELSGVTLEDGRGRGAAVLVGSELIEAAAEREGDPATMDLTDAVVTGHAGGAAVEVREDSDVTISRTDFTGNGEEPVDVNRAAAELPIGGGALNNDDNGKVVVVDSSFSGNQAAFGGGAIQNRDEGEMQVSRSTFEGNSAGFAGGAVLNEDTAVLTISASTFSGNSVVAPEFNAEVDAAAAPLSAGGGAFYAAGQSRLTVVNSTVHGNSTNAQGGALHTSGRAVFEATNATISGNSAGGMGGAVFDGTSVNNADDALFTFLNTIVDGNSHGDGPNGCADADEIDVMRSAGHNLESTETCGFDAEGDQPGVDALLEPLGDNGGPTLTRALVEASPAVDAAAADGCPEADQRGVDRPQREACDAGAFELEASEPEPEEEKPAPAAPASGGGPAPVQPQIQVLGESARSCGSRRRFRIRLRIPRDAKVRKIVVRVDGELVKVRRRAGRRTAIVDLRTLPLGRYRVKIVVRLAGGDKLTGTRRYRTCTKGIPSTRIPPL